MNLTQYYLGKNKSIKLEDMDMNCIADFEEMGIYSEEIEIELKIPNSDMNLIFSEYAKDYRGD